MPFSYLSARLSHKSLENYQHDKTVVLTIERTRAATVANPLNFNGQRDKKVAVSVSHPLNCSTRR